MSDDPNINYRWPCEYPDCKSEATCLPCIWIDPHPMSQNASAAPYSGSLGVPLCDACFRKAAAEPDYFLKFDNIKAGVIMTLRQRNALPDFKTVRLSRQSVHDEFWKIYSRQRMAQRGQN